jgi:hypothetical protein
MTAQLQTSDGITAYLSKWKLCNWDHDSPSEAKRRKMA